jgi:hypothetical protein
VSRFAKDDPNAAACIEAIIAACAEHGFTLAHEDGQGAFILEPRDADPAVTVLYENWLREAFLQDGRE